MIITETHLSSSGEVMSISKRVLFAILLCFIAGAHDNAFGQESGIVPWELPSHFTAPSVVPHGCLSFVPALFEPPSEGLFFDETFSVVSGFSGNMRIRVWRIGCWEPGRSAIALSLSSDNPLLRYPLVSLVNSNGVEQLASISLFDLDSGHRTGRGYTSSQMNETAFPFYPDGVTLIVNAISIESNPDLISVADYNDQITLKLEFENGQVEIPVFAYEPALDPPQSESPVFNGRYSGQWTVPELPRSGLVLQIAEIPLQRNFIFAIWFTYLDGNPIWVVGNADIPNSLQNEIEIPMSMLEGGGFLTSPGSFTADDVSVTSVGTMTVRANHCNEIEADIDFSSSGLGTENLTFNRLIRIAGYDCDQTR